VKKLHANGAVSFQVRRARVAGDAGVYDSGIAAGAEEDSPGEGTGPTGMRISVVLCSGVLPGFQTRTEIRPGRWASSPEEEAMKKKSSVTSKAERQLEAYLNEAAEGNATEVRFEYVPEGLEVFFMLGDTGAGMILRNQRVSGEIMQLLGERTGASIWQVRGRPLELVVEEYESFGECAFRVRFKGSPRSR